MASNTDETHPEIPDHQWSTPLGEDTPLGQLYRRRVKQESDLVVVVSDHHNRRGTGKTVASLKLAKAMDRTDEGVTRSKVSLSPEEVRESYAREPKGSALILDEAEAGISNRESMTNVNKAMRKIMSMGRIEEKYLVMNAPASSHIDKSIKELADVWLLVQRKGEALVHFFEYEPYSNKPLTPIKQTFQWDDIETGTQLRDVYNYLTREKQGRIQGKDGSGYIERAEHEKILKQTKQQVEKDTRDSIIRSICNHPSFEATNELSQSDIAEATGMSQNSISRIARGEQ